MLYTDSDIINGLKAGAEERLLYEKILFQQYYYFTGEGTKKYSLSFDDSVSVYSDAILTVIHDIVDNEFDGHTSIKIYLYRVFSNKCIDLVRKNSTNRLHIHNTFPLPEIQGQLPDITQNLIEKVFGKTSMEPAYQVLLGASAPTSCSPGEQFTARFIAYVESIEKQIRKKLIQMSEDSAIHLDIKRCRWQKGTNVKIKVYGDHLSVDPSYEQFTWEGLYNIIDFDVVVSNEVAATKTILKFDVAIDEIIVARLRFDLKITWEAENKVRKMIKDKPIETAFASYASEDRNRVLDRVSEITRNGIDVYMDCLSMRPGERWKEVLEKEIKERETFLLFWSAYAKDSEMVAWEWKTALYFGGLAKIDPHPLSPVSEAEPPEELKELHFGDVYINTRGNRDESTLQKNDQFHSSGYTCYKILLMHQKGYTDKEIAEQLGIFSAAIVRTSRLRCLEKLRRYLSENI